MFARLLSISLGAILVENFIFSKFLGICPFLGVSKKMDTAVGMGVAVIFVMALASAACWAFSTWMAAFSSFSLLASSCWRMISWASLPARVLCASWSLAWFSPRIM